MDWPVKVIAGRNADVNIDEMVEKFVELGNVIVLDEGEVLDEVLVVDGVLDEVLVVDDELEVSLPMTVMLLDHAFWKFVVSLFRIWRYKFVCPVRLVPTRPSDTL
jgi:hypothetical protein